MLLQSCRDLSRITFDVGFQQCRWGRWHRITKRIHEEGPWAQRKCLGDPRAYEAGRRSTRINAKELETRTETLRSYIKEGYFDVLLDTMGHG